MIWNNEINDNQCFSVRMALVSTVNPYCTWRLWVIIIHKVYNICGPLFKRFLHLSRFVTGLQRSFLQALSSLIVLRLSHYDSSLIVRLFACWILIDFYFKVAAAAFTEQKSGRLFGVGWLVLCEFGFLLNTHNLWGLIRNTHTLLLYLTNRALNAE